MRRLLGQRPEIPKLPVPRETTASFPNPRSQRLSSRRTLVTESLGRTGEPRRKSCVIRLWGLKSRDPGPQSPGTPGGPAPCPQHPPALFCLCQGLLAPSTAVAASRGGAASAPPPAPSDSLQESPALWLVPKTPPPRGLAFCSSGVGGVGVAVRARVLSSGQNEGGVRGAGLRQNKGLTNVWDTSHG